VLQNAGDGTFAPRVSYSSGAAPTSVTVGDWNADGYLDIAVTNSGSNNVGVLSNDGSGRFGAQATYATDAGPLSVATSDFDGDGYPDLAVANGEYATVSLLLAQCQ